MLRDVGGSILEVQILLVSSSEFKTKPAKVDSPTRMCDDETWKLQLCLPKLTLPTLVEFQEQEEQLMVDGC